MRSADRHSTAVTAAQLEYQASPGHVWRVGWAPDPWAWIDWKWASDDGRFDGRWDDERAQFRTIYAGESLLGCYLEVLAKHRPDVPVGNALAEIVEDPADSAEYPTGPPGTLGYSWLEGRMVAEAMLRGIFCRVTAASSIARLRPVFISLARRMGAADFDAAVLKDSAPRHLTRSVSSWIYEHAQPGTGSVDGIAFRSRHGDELAMWAIFERGPQPVSPRLSSRRARYVVDDEPALSQAMALFGITWA